MTYLRLIDWRKSGRRRRILMTMEVSLKAISAVRRSRSITAGSAAAVSILTTTAKQKAEWNEPIHAYNLTSKKVVVLRKRIALS